MPRPTRSRRWRRSPRSTTAALLTSSGRLDPYLIPVAVILAAGAFAPLAALTGTLREVGQVERRRRAHRGVVASRAGGRRSSSTSRPRRGGSQPRRASESRSTPSASGTTRISPRSSHDVSFAIEPGRTTALVGHSGAGKSTCANLLLRLWDVDAGAVTVGGVDVRDLVQRDLRSMIAVVPQDVYLFHTSVGDNLRIGSSDATDDAGPAGRRPRAGHAVHRAPCRMGSTRCSASAGASISGGQRQRLAIARALLRDAPILVMDEAVANLDAESEAALRTAMAEVARDRTTLLIAHRPSTIRHRGSGGRARPRPGGGDRDVRGPDGGGRAPRDAARRDVDDPRSGALARPGDLVRSSSPVRYGDEPEVADGRPHARQVSSAEVAAATSTDDFRLV